MLRCDAQPADTFLPLSSFPSGLTVGRLRAGRVRPLTAAFIGSRGAAFASALARAAYTVRWASRLSARAVAHCDVVVRVFRAGDARGRRSFTVAAEVCGRASLGVELHDTFLLVGPLTLPRRPVCGYCGVERLCAAAHALGRARRCPCRRLSQNAVEALGRELRLMARSGLRQSRLVDHVLVVNLEAGTSTLHRVVPLPHCPVCGGAAARTPLGEGQALSPRSTPTQVWNALGGWIDEWTGVVSGAVLEPRLDERLPHIVTTAPPAVRDQHGSLRLLPLGWGKGLTLSTALLSAAGEAIERYAASLPNPAHLVWKRPAELQGDYLDPRDLRLYSDSQYRRRAFPFARYSARARHPWVRGRWLTTQDPVWVPAICVFLSLTLERTQLICQGTSNGLAAAPTIDDAALRATLELIERDALMASWVTARPGRRLATDSSWDPRLRRVVDAIETMGASVEVYVLSTSAYGSTVLCLALGDGTHYPGVTVAMGAGADTSAALRSAVLELGQTGPFLRRAMQSGTLAVPGRPSAVRSMLDHAAYYFPKHRAHVFDRLRSSATPVRLRDLPRVQPRWPLQHCARALGGAGIRVAVVDVTTTDVAGSPFRVARAVSPDLQPLSYGFGLDRVAVDRIRALGICRPVPPVQPVW